MLPSRSNRPLSPFKRRVAAALIASLPAVLAARAVLVVVPDPAQNAALGDLLFGVAVQAVVTALLLPLAERLFPDAP